MEEAAREERQEPREEPVRQVGGKSPNAKPADAASKVDSSRSIPCKTALTRLLDQAGLSATRRLAAKAFLDFPKLRRELSADDFHSECWVRVMKSGNSFEGRSVAQALAWFAQAARNTALDLLRKSPPVRESRCNLERRPIADVGVRASSARLRMSGESSLESCTHDRRLIAGSRCPVADPSATPDDNVAKIKAAIKRLDSRSAKILRLRAIEERTLLATATRMDMETKQVSMTLWRARESIRALLPEDLRRIVDLWSARRASRELEIESRKSRSRGGASPRVPESPSPESRVPSPRVPESPSPRVPESPSSESRVPESRRPRVPRIASLESRVPADAKTSGPECHRAGRPRPFIALSARTAKAETPTTAILIIRSARQRRLPSLLNPPSLARGSAKAA